MANVIDVARHILDKRGPMSSMKLQKLVYYSQAWHLVFDGEPLFDEEIQAWVAGPVVYELYKRHKGVFSLGPDFFPEGDPSRLSETETETINSVLDSYGSLSALQLSNLTHDEKPWQDARKGLSDRERGNVTIEPAAMQEFYEQMHRENPPG